MLDLFENLTLSTRGEEILARRNEAKKGELDEQLRVRSDFF